MFVPHSERPVHAFQLEGFSLVFVTLLGLAVLVSLGFLLANTGSAEIIAHDSRANLARTEANLEQFRIEVTEFLEVYDLFQGVFNDTLRRADSNAALESPPPSGPDLAAILRTGTLSSAGVDESELLGRAVASLRNSLGSLSQLADVVVLHTQLVEDMPTLWPVINGLGQVTMEFGPNIHPILNSWYMHRGFDIWHFPGTPIVASGNGVVADARFDPVSGFGWFVEIDHPYGFRTKYTHMSSLSVSRGDTVTQGQRIGALGSSGLVTGPHLHFEIQLGTELIDPAYFLRLSKPDFNRRVLDRR